MAAQPSNGYGNNKLFTSRKRCKNVAGEGKSNKMRAKLAVEHENSSVRPMHIHPWSSQLQRGSRRNNFSYTCHAPPTNRAKCVETLAWRTAPHHHHHHHHQPTGRVVGVRIIRARMRGRWSVTAPLHWAKNHITSRNNNWQPNHWVYFLSHTIWMNL